MTFSVADPSVASCPAPAETSPSSRHESKPGAGQIRTVSWTLLYGLLCISGISHMAKFGHLRVGIAFVAVKTGWINSLSGRLYHLANTRWSGRRVVS